MNAAATAPREVAACPWCGSGTPLVIRGDGFGQVSLCCTVCGCKGPPTRIHGEFAQSDEVAIQRWSVRGPGGDRRVDHELRARIQSAVALASLMGTLSDRKSRSSSATSATC